MSAPRAVSRSGLATLAAALAMTLAACGGPSGSSGLQTASSGDSGIPEAAATEETSSARLDAEQAVLSYARCMRDNGVAMPDPELDESGHPEIGGPGQEALREDPDFAAAQKICAAALQAIQQPSTTAGDRE